jgi:hypothetical protein
MRNLVRAAWKTRPGIMNDKAVAGAAVAHDVPSVIIHGGNGHTAACIQRVVDQLLQNEAPELGFRHPCLLGQGVDGPEQDPVRALKLKFGCFRLGGYA